jgi:hypothetical protein
MLFFTSSFFSSITAIHQTKEADEIIWIHWNLRGKIVGEFAVHSIFAVSEIVMNAWIVDSLNVLFRALGRVSASVNWKVLWWTKSRNWIEFFVKKTFFWKHSTNK